MVLYSLDLLRSHVTGTIDLLLCSVSFEGRCRSVADNMDNSLISRVAIAQNQNHAIYHKDNPDYLCQKFSGKCGGVILDTDKPILSADGIWKELSDIFQGSAKRVLIDISTFTHEALLIILRAAFLLARPSDEIRFAYVPAEYSVGDEPQDKWLSKGIREIRSVVGYPGELLPSRKIHLIVLVGFETERARALIEAYEPAFISLGYSTEVGSTSKENYTASNYFHAKMMTLFPNSNKFEFSATNFAETAKVLKSVAQGQTELNTVIAPLNTKLSTIGSALAAIADDTIQLCYAQAELYNYENYSKPSASCYLFTIPGLGKAL